MTAAIVIPVFNRRDITLRFLRSLYSDKPDNFFIIVIDSGSTDGTGPAIRENYPDVILLQATPAAWWAAATNMGTKEAIRRGCSYIITCNDDSLVSVNALNHMLETARENPDSIISATVCYLDARDTVYFAGRKRSKFTDRFFYIANSENYNKLTDDLGEADLLHGMCTLFPATVFGTVGYFDEINFPHLFADDDLVLRAREHGYRLLVDHRAVIFNEHTATGINPYQSRSGPMKIIDLLVSRQSVFQVSTRTRFLWRHKRSLLSFIVTWLADYCRLFCVIVLRWCLPEEYFRKLARVWLNLASR